MSTKKHGLGKGFESLIPTQIVEEALDPTAKADGKLSQLTELPIGKIVIDEHQPRENFDEKSLAGLADSIKHHGILQPLIVTKQKNGDYKIIAGERRYRAAKIAKLKTLPVLVRSLSAQHTLEVALVENVQRKNLRPLELATAYLKLHEQFNMSYTEISERVGKTIGAISNVVRLLGLSTEVRTIVNEGMLGEGHARALLSISDKAEQIEVAHRMVNEGWSVRKAEAYVARRRAENKEKATGSTGRDKRMAVRETKATKNVASKLKTNVYLQPKARGGRIVIEYKDDAELDRLFEIL